MLRPLKIPRGVANLLSIGNSSTIIIDEKYKHRPDKILDSMGMKSLSKEVTNNYMSVTSPISCENQDVYTITDSLFNSYFMR